jgi:nucleotide-binding universal stress UspA family protein/predicted phosphoribosyltransferase
MSEHTVFNDRYSAGAALAERLTEFAHPDTLILGIPGGGVVVGSEIAARLNAPISSVQLTVDHHRESLGNRMRSRLGHRSMFDSASRAAPAATGRSRTSAPTATMPDVNGRVVIVVDDGLHDDVEVHQTLQAFRGRGAKKLIYTVPFATPAILQRHRSEVDEIIALETADDIGDPRSWYKDATSPDLETVRSLLSNVEVTEEISDVLYQSILVPYDFSDTARRALSEATRIAQLTDARLHLLHVAPPERATDEVLPELNTLADIAEHPDREGVTITHGVTFGAPDALILEAIDTGGFDLVVMGTNGRQGIRAILVGSVAQKVVRSSPIPVMVLS